MLTEPQLQVIFVDLNGPEDILSLEDSVVMPVLYSRVTGIDTLPLNEKKDKFIAAVLPAILVAKYRVKQERARLQALMKSKRWSAEDSLFYEKLCTDYKTDNNSVLLNRLILHPNSIILAQAIVESGWGSSRVFQDANNMFGIWSYNPREPRIAARFKRNGNTIYLRKYKDLSESIEDYFKTVARTNVYRDFRRARLETSNPYALLPHLRDYSERKDDYVIQLSGMIRFNKLTEYDHYVLDSAYIQPLTYLQ